MRNRPQGGGEWADELAAVDGPLDVAFRPVVNHFRGRQSVELHLVDWRPAGAAEPARPASAGSVD